MESRVSSNRGGAIQKQSAEDLREIAERCQRLIELSPSAILVHSHGEIVFANPALVELLGARNTEEILGCSPLDFVHPDFKEIIKGRIDRIRHSGKPNPPEEQKLVRFDGAVLYVEARANLVPWKGEMAVQVILQDITERKEIENQLRESEARFHQLADSMPQIVWTADAAGHIDYQNRKFFERTKLPEESVRTDSWKKILHPDDVAVAEKKWWHSVKTGEPFEMEYRYYDAESGAYRWHLGRALPVKDEAGKVLRWFGTCTDIHDQKQTELDLQRVTGELSRHAETLEQKVMARTASLQSSVKCMEEFCHSIAHNLRAPLRAMQGFAAAMLEDHVEVLDQTGQDYAKRIGRAAAHMDALIHDLLAYGQLNHQKLNIGAVELEPLIHRVISHFEAHIQARGASIRLGNLRFQAWANASVLEQIFINFVSNALKFVQPEVAPIVEIWAEPRDNRLRVWVKDNGIGIAPEHQKRIFKPFERLHPTDVFPGTGIGLALVAKGAERLGGSVGLESKAGEGSCFWIEIPMQRENAVTPE